jgi:hypothetical protein
LRTSRRVAVYLVDVAAAVSAVFGLEGTLVDRDCGEVGHYGSARGLAADALASVALLDMHLMQHVSNSDPKAKKREDYL